MCAIILDMEKVPDTGEIEQKESPKKIVGKITVVRHGDTRYTGVYPDLTDVGVEQISDQSESLATDIDLNKEEVILVSSPSPRTKGSMDLIKEKLGLVEKKTNVVNGIRGIDVKDRSKAMEIIDEVMAGGFDITKIDHAYATDPRFEDMPDVWEAPSNVEKRALRSLEYAIRGLLKAREINEDKIPHIIATSHFEIVDLLLAKVFDREPGDFPPGSRVDLVIFEDDSDSGKMRLEVSFRGETRPAVFDRQSRTIENI